MTRSKEHEITPETRVSSLLETYPELEETLISLAPAFAKLRNPILRKTVAKVTSLRQAARVGSVPLGKMINDLRRAAGQDNIVVDEESATSDRQPPPWVTNGDVVETIDARPMIEAGEQPLGPVMKSLRKLKERQLLRLLTPFQPAPLIDAAAKEGYVAFTGEDRPGQWTTHFGVSGK
jgi:hypothetical protein